MDLGKLREIKSLIDEEVELYSTLKSLFQEKRKVLVSNDVEALLSVDDRILNIVASIETAVNYRKRFSETHYGRNLNMSEMIFEAEKLDNDLAVNFKDGQTIVQNLMKEIAHEERVIKELLRHGMNLVNKKLNMISNATSIAGDYNRTGRSVNSSIDRISSVVEEV